MAHTPVGQLLAQLLPAGEKTAWRLARSTGVVGFYGLSLITLSFSLRKWLGQRAWRRLHYLTFGLYVPVTVHGLTAGTDSRSLGIRALYIGSALLVLFLTNYRLLTLAKPVAVKAARPRRVD